MAIKNLEDALIEELRDLLSAETQLTKALPKMAKAAKDDELKSAFQSHLKETQQHVTRLKSALEELGKAARSKTCEAMKGLLKEGEGLMEEETEGPVGDVMLIAAAQKVEHYEIASYGTVKAWAETHGAKKILDDINATLREEEAADRKLNTIAKRLNKAAMVPG